MRQISWSVPCFRVAFRSVPVHSVPENRDPWSMDGQYNTDTDIYSIDSSSRWCLDHLAHLTAARWKQARMRSTLVWKLITSHNCSCITTEYYNWHDIFLQSWPTGWTLSHDSQLTCALHLHHIRVQLTTSMIYWTKVTLHITSMTTDIHWQVARYVCNSLIQLSYRSSWLLE